jgi:hypothetical protein
MRVERPRGFWRRNWLALMFFASFLFLSVFSFILLTPTRFSVSCYDGTVYMISDDAAVMNSFLGPIPKSFTFDAGWGAPHFGYPLRWWGNYNSGGLRVPVWLPLLCLAGWISFREWQRHRMKLYGTPNAS